MKNKKSTHIIMRNGNPFCLHCGESLKLTFPIGIPEMVGQMNDFSKKHLNCPITYIEPVVDQSLSIEEKSDWWIENGEIGLSSKTMWDCFSSNISANFEIYHPHDPDDFSRCYKLLETIPEWKARSYMDKLSRLSKGWSNLISHWDELTKMYVRNMEENWKNAEEIGMYELMQKLIESKN